MIIELFGIPLSGKTTKKNLKNNKKYFSYKRFYIFYLYKKNRIDFLTFKLLNFFCIKVEAQKNILIDKSFLKKNIIKIMTKILNYNITPYVNKDYDLIKSKYSNFLLYFHKINKKNTTFRKKNIK